MKLVLVSAAVGEGGGKGEQGSIGRQSINASFLLTRRMCTTTRLLKRGAAASASHMGELLQLKQMLGQLGQARKA
jgi:hypothetical protein